MDGPTDVTPATEPEEIPVGQVLFDEIFLFALLSFGISFVLYNMWGMLELLRAPVLP